MPRGGQISAGSGLRLQSSSPGVTDNGNFNISGVGRSTGGTLGAIGPYLDTSGFQTPCVYGLYQTFRFPGTNALDSCAVGNGITLGGIPAAGNTSAADQTLVGNGITSGTRGNTVIGATSNCDGNAGASGVATGFHVAIGRATLCTSDITNNRGLNVLIGANGTASGGAIVAIGGGINASGKTGGGAKGGIYIGQYVFSSAGTNQIILDSRSDGSAQLPDETRSNLIKIGDTTHTTVEVGGRSLAGMGGTVQNNADGNYTIVATDRAVYFSTLTAARVITLPAANAVPRGYVALVVDTTGNASGVNTITVQRAGADTINGGTTSVINTAFGSREFFSDGVSKWTVIRSL